MGLIHSYTNSIPMEYVINLFILTNIFISLTSKVNSMDILNPNESNVRNKYSDSPHNRSIVSSTNQYHSQQQYFRVRPRSNVEVIEGSSIVLQCSVGNQAGPVQWAKDGFVLGFDRSIPGYPRYRMDGNPSEGVHNLKIERASIDDDGEYQCQVGPATNNKAIRANSRLTVLLKPKKIEINGHTNGSAVEIREGEKVTLTCLVYGGKPAAKIKWFRKDIELKTDNLPNQSVLTVTSSLNEGSSSDQITATKSQLLLNLHSEDNGVTYSCSASHPALSNPLRSTVSMSVLYPPGPPEILGYSTGKAVRSGDTLKLRCRSRGGNPLAQLVWYKDDEQVDFSFDSYAGRESVNEYIFTVKPEHNNAKLTCESKTPINPTPMTTSVTLSVQFAPSKVTIVGPDEAKAGDNVTMICKTDASNPPSELSWSIDGRTIRTENIYKSHSKGGYITTTNITLPILSTERSMKTFSCFAVNQALDKTVPASHALSILYAPFNPSIVGYDESQSLHSGTVKRFTCESQGGNPLADLKWFKGKEEITSGWTVTSTVNGVSSELTLVVTDSDNGAIYRCEASNAASKEPLEASVKLKVYFAPSKVKIKSRPARPKAGNKVDLICETESSNPASEVVWWRNGQLLPGHVNSTIDSSFGGKSTKNVLKMNVTSSDDGSIFTCQAINKLLDQSVHDALTLNVLFKPEFISSEPLASFELVEGSEASINLTARGNPSNIKYKWHRINGNGELDATRFYTDGPILNITSVLRQDSGSYLIEASNSQGTTKLPFKLNIKYAATITKTSDLVLVEMGKTAYLECTVDANPITADLIKWQRKPNYIENSMDDSLESTFSSSTLPNEFISMDEERFKITLEENRSFLSVFNITESDSGAYECLASNGIGSPDKATTNLVVKHKPRIINSPILSKSASDNGSKGKLICRAQGAPNITFQWLREGAIISDKPGNTKYNTEPAEQLNLITYQSVLIINEVANSDYGPYDCVASNELGINRLTVHFNHTSQPDPPLVLKVVNRTSSSVTLKWIPGFDGGLPQSFRIRYQKVDATGSTTLPSPNPTSSASLPNTQSTPDASSSISTEPAQYSDVYPSNTTIYTIKGLTDNTEYSFNVMAYNDLGESKYTHDIVKGKTLQETPISETERISQVFSGRSGDVPRLIIIAVSILGSSLLLLNVVLVVCFVRKRRKKRLEEADGSSTNKPTTIEMYAPASGSGGSYTNGPNETSLSGSDEEKHSEGAYSGHTDYDMEMNPGDTLNGNQQNIHPNIHSYMHGNIHQSLSTYLIDDTLDHVTSYYQPMFGQENKCINIPPVPPLRSINLASFLPMINEEPLFINSSPLGHLV
ncbi:nephrin isoform X2 [Tetranychus urticae]|uniref:nephrin isoform X2 n=1 Tax=Tetranychus urticae TaxID=32264 RepID=UPI00077BE0D3|nr:nephrin isoform X2 [Tetranychus urticae]